MTLSIDGTGGAGFSGQASGTVSLTTSLVDDVIVVFVFNEKSGSYQSVSGISDTAGLAWTKRKTYELTADTGSNIDVWWAVASTALSADTITVTLTGNIDDAVIIAFGVHGANTAAPWDTNAALPAAASASSTNGSVDVSTSAADTMLLGFWGTPTGSVGTVGAGYTQIAQQNNAGGSRFAYATAEYALVSSAQSATAVTIGSALEAWGMVGDAIVAAGVAPSVIPKASVVAPVLGL